MTAVGLLPPGTGFSEPPPPDSPPSQPPPQLDTTLARNLKRPRWAIEDDEDDYEDDYDGLSCAIDSCNNLNVLNPLLFRKPLKIRALGLTNALNISRYETELMWYFCHHPNRQIVAANPKTDAWIGSGPQKAGQAESLKQICLFMAQMELTHRGARCKYMVNDKEYPKSRGQPPKNLITGYAPLDEARQEQFLRQFIDMLQWYRHDFVDGGPVKYPILMVTSFLLLISCLYMGPLVPLINSEGGGDIFGMLVAFKQRLHIYSGPAESGKSSYAVLFDENRHYLPREEDMWDIVNMVEEDERYSLQERRELKVTLTKEVCAMIELFNMDVEAHSITHLTSWALYWNKRFVHLKEEQHPYAIMLMAYWCAYSHQFHEYQWWRDRSYFDLYDLIEYLPEEYIKHVKWPLAVVENYEYNHEDLLNGNFRKVHSL